MKLSKPAFHPEGAPQPPAGESPPPAGGAAPPSDAPKMPSGLAPKYWDASGGKVNQDALLKDFTDLSDFKKQHDERIASLPKTPEEYKFEFKPPKEFKAPEGLQFKVDPKDPLVAMVRKVAYRNQWPQSVVDDLVTEHAMLTIENGKIEGDRLKAERAKLGEKADDRLKAVDTYVQTLFKKDSPHYQVAMDIATDAAGVEFLEALIAKATATAMPGAQPNPPKPAAQPQDMADRWYNQQKAS